MGAKWELPIAFYFQVTIGNQEYAFKEVSGLTTEMETEAIQEGGVNSYIHLLPKRNKHNNLTLKRALHPISQTDVKWIQPILEGNFEILISTRNILVKLLNSEGTAIYTWSCENAYPVKWEIENLDSEKNSVLIESMEFAYAQLKRL